MNPESKPNLNQISFILIDQNCFYLLRVVDEKTNVIMIGGQPRQFRMKLPEKEFVAIVAVGLR